MVKFDIQVDIPSDVLAEPAQQGRAHPGASNQKRYNALCASFDRLIIYPDKGGRRNCDLSGSIRQISLLWETDG